MDSIIFTYILTGSTEYIGFYLFLKEIDEKKYPDNPVYPV